MCVRVCVCVGGGGGGAEMRLLPFLHLNSNARNASEFFKCIFYGIHRYTFGTGRSVYTEIHIKVAELPCYIAFEDLHCALFFVKPSKTVFIDSSSAFSVLCLTTMIC